MPKSRELAASISRRRWSIGDARIVLKALAESGLSARAFAKREGIDAQRVQSWKRRLGGAAPLELVEVTHRSDLRGPDLVEVALLSGRILRVPASIDAGALRRFVDILEDGGC